MHELAEIALFCKKVKRVKLLDNLIPLEQRVVNVVCKMTLILHALQLTAHVINIVGVMANWSTIPVS